MSSRYDKIDLILKIINSVAIVVGLVITCFTIQSYHSQRFFDEKVKIFSEISESTSRLANTPIDDTSFKIEFKQFDIMFYGKSHIFESQELEDSLVSFRETVEHLRMTRKGRVGEDKLKIMSLKIAKLCNKFLNE